MNGDILGLLRDRIDLRRVPFTEPESRLLVFGDGDVFRIALAAYETRPRDTVAVADLRLIDADGAALDPSVTTFPDRIECATRLGLFRICFADRETLVVAPPPVVCGVSFAVPAASVDAAGEEPTGAADRAVAWRTTDAATCDIAAGAEGTQRVRCRFEAAADAALAICVGPGDWPNSPALGAGEALAAARDRWQAWFAAAPEVVEPYRAQAAWA
ncbi:MAG TPA: hypothetical protein VFI22_05240, partial [Thermomicrobiales bacterium]|nr:hypothetical protein [Thermomicrobiales bacterium]